MQRDSILDLMLCYGLLEILNDFIFELVFSKPKMSHVATEHGHDEWHRHTSLQLACIRLSTAAETG